MNPLYFVTSNPRKFKEIQHLLSEFNIEQLEPDFPEIQGEVHEIITHKVLEAAKTFNKPVFVDDTHIIFEAWNNLPGAYIKDFMDNLGCDNLVKMLNPFENKKAKAVCLIGYAAPNQEPKVFEGSVEGIIVPSKGDMKFSFDPIFQPDGFEKTFAEMELAEKNAVSHRGKALEKFRAFLKDIDS